ncbi:MAG: tetratricopeptide repeat protein [Planctomycetes bacterium]|nr:tetratricopeptide repeat protein [Planctomycetota bacterium]
MTAEKRTPEDRKQSGRARKPAWWLRLLAALLSPILFLAGIELVLTLVGYGHPQRFLVPWKSSGRTVYLANSHYGEHFVPKELSRTPEPCVLGPKGDSTIRIFVLGSSAAYGDPEPAYGFCRQLEVLLHEHAEGKSFEVVNAAMTAMNSHVVRRVAQDCARHQPDLFLVYLGNNEVVGPYGPPTLPDSLYAHRRFINACITAKKQTRIGQLLKNLSQTLHTRGRPEKKWQGMESFLASRITADDPKLKDCYRHFRDNLDDIVQTAQRCGAGVILCTVPTNLRSCAPFGSEHKPGLTADQLARWDESFQQGRDLERAGRWAEALSAYETAQQIDDSHAALAFCLGTCLEALGRTEEAKPLFVTARDRDVLRFRADSELLNVIRETAQAYAAQRIRLLDLETELSAGWDGSPRVDPADPFVDHVHLGFRGNFLAARAALSVIRELMPQAGLREPRLPEGELLDLCRRRLLFDAQEQYRLAMVMYRRKTLPPFESQINHEAEMASLRDELVRLRRAEQTPDSASLQEALQRRPTDTYLILRQGQFLIETGRPREAIEWYRKTLDARPSDMRIRVALAQLLAQSAARKEAVELLTSRQTPDRLSRRDALLLLGAHCASGGYIPQAAAIYEDLGRQDGRNVDVLVNRAAAALHAGDLPAMKQYLDNALTRAPASVQALTNMGNYYAKENQPRAAQQWFARAVQAQPQNPFAHLGLALQSVRLNEMDKALVHATRAMTLKPDFLEAHLLLAGLYDKAGRKDEAQRHLELYTLFKGASQR